MIDLTTLDDEQLEDLYTRVEKERRLRFELMLRDDRGTQTAGRFTAKMLIERREERDRAIGALGVLVHDGVITSGRMRELLGMDIMKQREEVDRILNAYGGTDA